MSAIPFIGAGHRLNPLTALPELSGVLEVLAVVAHPDDESFGLGGILAALVQAEIKVRLLCLTAGEASTIGAGADLAERRRAELAEAADRLGISASRLETFPDGGLSALDPAQLAAVVEANLGLADALAVFEPAGVTGHPDHCAASGAARIVADRHGLITLEWGLAQTVADTLKEQFGAPFLGFEAVGNWPVEIVVDRTRQRSAIACHRSQEPDNPVLQRRLSLEADRELVRVRSAPYQARLGQFVKRAEPFATSAATGSNRLELLRLLVGFAAGATWPADLWQTESSFTQLLWGKPGSWSLHGELRLGDLSAPAPSSTISWGAVATVAGIDCFRPASATGESGLAHLVARGGGYVYSHQLAGEPTSNTTARASVRVMVP
ncbi:MAG TPA: PIG-L deacetylase family protein [Candidatus Nanopelagicaceae bacterium]|nr:PIG-L deacetylase family protein [Candidatus Nanopelagicaceae bacterium]